MDLKVFRSSVRWLAFFAVLVAARAAADGYHLLKTISIPGDYGWDSDDAGHVFVNMQDLGTLLRIDAEALKITGTWLLAPCGQPSSMDIDRAHQRIFIGCRSGVMTVVNSATGKIVDTQPIGKGVDAAEFDPGTGLVYFSSGAGDGSLAVFHEDTPDMYTLVETVKTLPGARTMALDRKTGRAYLSAAKLGPVPAPTTDVPRPRAPMIPGSFEVLVFGK